MEFVKTESQNRRDVYFMAKCEGCGNVEKGIAGYDDNHYWQNVLPDMKCKVCGQSTKTLSHPEGHKVMVPVPKYSEETVV